eukprot:GILJ01031916.1.p1 GENE.GILJ01031916.1~~GILJ01031916.1.p1  ORF type:complete len:221 (+),score=22.99 GILJ01031916.1:604-1266(+)
MALFNNSPLDALRNVLSNTALNGPKAAIELMSSPNFGDLSQVAKVLLSNGWRYMSPMRLAVHFNRLDVLKEIVRKVGDKKGASMLKEKTGTEHPTLLHVAVRRNYVEMTQYLIDRGLDVNECGSSLLSTPLHIAAENGALECATLLIRNGAKKNPKDKSGKQALHYAAKAGAEKLVEYLLGKGADPSSRCSEGNLPLYYAAEGGDTATIDLLRKYTTKNK